MEGVEPFQWTPEAEGVDSYGPLPGCGPPAKGLSEAACMVQPFVFEDQYDRVVVGNYEFPIWPQ